MFPKEIICLDETMLKQAQACSQLLSIPIHKAPSQDQFLNFENGMIDVVSKQKKQQLSYCHDFTANAITRRLQTQDQHLLKAFKDKQKHIITILDVTAGWCRDSFILAQNGYDVKAVEQSDLIHYLTQHSLKRYKLQHKLSLDLYHGNALNYLKHLSDLPNAIYLDPMFPSSHHQAKNKKEIQLLQAITNNANITELFRLALNKAEQRVVVKRALNSEFLDQQKPDFQYKGKTIRFDVYQCF